MELLRRLGAWCWGGAYISNGKMGFLPVKWHFQKVCRKMF
jgi:hypothetical protein